MAVSVLPVTRRGRQNTRRAVFGYGVGSGDPRPDGVVLWTRIGGGNAGDVTVRWVVAADAALTEVVDEGTETASADDDHTVHVAVAGLTPGRTWFYVFEAGGERSPVGRTRTAPAPGDPRPVRLGVVSCSAYPFGHFGAYRRLADRDVDAVVHLGDTIYERFDAGTRTHDPAGTVWTLDGYRARHAQYHTDGGLQRLWQHHPVIAVWDDHDIAGNAWAGGAGTHDPDRHGDWEDRRAAATRAWREWTPVGAGAEGEIWRSLRLGRTVELLMLDTRLDGRAEQVSDGDPDPAAAVADPGRTLLGDRQRQWLHDRLVTSDAAWRILGNQVVLSPLTVDAGPLGSALSGLAGGAVTAGDRVLNPDQWDGYEAERRRLLDALRERSGPVAVLTGDIHSSWAIEVPGGVAVELVAPAIASEPFADVIRLPAAEGLATSAIRAANPHVKWADLDASGYLVVEASAERLDADWWHLDDVEDPDATESWAKGFTTRDGATLQERGEPMSERQEPAPGPPAPPRPPDEEESSSGPWWPKWAAAVGAAGAAAGGLLALRRRRAHQ